MSKKDKNFRLKAKLKVACKKTNVLIKINSGTPYCITVKMLFVTGVRYAFIVRLVSN